MRRTAGQSAAVIGTITSGGSDCRGTDAASLRGQHRSLDGGVLALGRVDRARGVELDSREEGFEEPSVDMPVEDEDVTATIGDDRGIEDHTARRDGAAFRRQPILVDVADLVADRDLAAAGLVVGAGPAVRR